jgi:hypothetical protein
MSNIESETSSFDIQYPIFDICFNAIASIMGVSRDHLLCGFNQPWMFDIVPIESHTNHNKGWNVMAIDGRDIREIGIWLLLLTVVAVTIALPLLSFDAPDAATAQVFTLILILEILFIFSLHPQLTFCAAESRAIRLRSPPNR